ncbi:hypothetical protein EF294_18255 [Gordonia oryzae]|uniref:DUF2029 domain-containing protein n=1 Tax=Gordonia oryzae TaxID=2487349 RepID=A0A3N4G3H1_9ACTN|nr:hypothetical protein [Gordonia oryzae]RPA57462.1 hypothetical protein EF294_18255 [Gordonia oryzae]
MSTTSAVGHDARIPDPGQPERASAASAPPALAWRSWLAPIGIYLLIRAVGVLMLARFDALRGSSLRDSLSAWDGKWMLAIAEHGYDGVPVELTDARGYHTADTAFAFFPGYPYTVGALAHLPFLSPFGAAVLLNLVLGCVAAVGTAQLGALCVAWMAGRTPMVAALAHTDPGDSYARRVGLYLVAIFAATPMSVVLNMAYTETLFCALSIWALVGVLQQRWVLAGICACLVGTVRPTAVVVIGVVMLAALIDVFGRSGSGQEGSGRSGSGWTTAGAWLALLLSPLGYLGYLAVVWAQTGSPTGWFTIQTQGWDTRFDWGVAAFTFVNDQLVNSGEVAPVATSWIIIATLVMVVVALWARLPWPVLTYGALVTASIVASSGLMMSRPRLLLPAFVLLLPLAIVLARARPAIGVAVMVPIVLASSWFGAHMLTVYPHAM